MEEGHGVQRGRVLVLVKIDVEGWETAVLEGMSELVRGKVARLVVFETGSTWEDARAAMPGETLERVVGKMARGGYKCFYIGVRFLHPLAPPLWDAVYDHNKQHRNVLCALDAPWLPALLRRYAILPPPVCM